MDKRRPSFSDDLRAIQGEVEADVGTILEIAKREGARPLGPESNQFFTGDKPAAGRRSHRTRKQTHAQRPERSDPPVLQNVTTRLSQETNMLLTEAALRQRLKRVTPATRQDIIEAALLQWLRKTGYLE